MAQFTAPTIHTTVEVVKQSMGLGDFDQVDDAWLGLCVDAVNLAICQWRPDLDHARCVPSHGGAPGGQFDPSQFAWTNYVTGGGNIVGAWQYTGNPRVSLGATMLAQRWYTRRNASEVAAFTEMGGPPPAIDRDIALLLEIQRDFRPVVA